MSAGNVVSSMDETTPEAYISNTTDNGKLLDAAHRRMLLEESGLSPEIVAERGYETVKSRAELPDFKNYQRRRGLLIPVRSPSGATSRRLRPDRPRKGKDGKQIKYEQPAETPNILDVHPRNVAALGDTGEDLWITEGEKKADSLTSRRLCAVAMFGVWGWCVAGTKGRELLPCFDHIALDGRRVYVVFDADIVEKENVQLALNRLVAALEDRGAEVLVVSLPGPEKGVDDFFVAGHTVAELKALAREFEPGYLGRVRLSRDEKLRAPVEAAWSRWEDEDWTRFFGNSDRPNKTRGHSCRDMTEVAIEQVTKSGKVVADGLEFSLDVRTWAERAELSRQSIMNNIPHLEATDWLRRVQGDRSSDEAARYVLRIPRANLYQEGSKAAQEGKAKGKETRMLQPYDPGGKGLRAPRRRWSAPTFDREDNRIIRGYVHRHGKVCGHALYRILNKGERRMSVDELAALLNVERPRDLTRRKSDGQGRDGELTRLENAGIIVIDDGYVEKTDNWRQALEIERELKGEIDAEERQREAHCRQRIAYRNRDKTEPEAHPANVEVDGYIGELRTAVAEPEVQIPEPEVSELAAAIRAYLDRNPGDACQPLGWIGTTLWAYELHPGNPTPDEVRTAITELGGGTYIRDTLERARGAA